MDICQFEANVKTEWNKNKSDNKGIKNTKKILVIYLFLLLILIIIITIVLNKTLK